MSLRDHLAHSIRSSEFVRVHREAIDGGYVDGRVLALGDEWLLLATVQAGGEYEVALRLLAGARIDS